MITTVFDCVSNSVDANDSEMTTIGLIAEYRKGNSQYRERVNLMLATTDKAMVDELEPGKKYVVTLVEVHDVVENS